MRSSSSFWLCIPARTVDIVIWSTLGALVVKPQTVNRQSSKEKKVFGSAAVVIDRPNLSDFFWFQTNRTSPPLLRPTILKRAVVFHNNAILEWFHSIHRMSLLERFIILYVYSKLPLERLAPLSPWNHPYYPEPVFSISRSYRIPVRHYVLDRRVSNLTGVGLSSVGCGTIWVEPPRSVVSAVDRGCCFHVGTQRMVSRILNLSLVL